MNVPALDVVTPGPLAVCQGPHAWAYQYGVDASGTRDGPYYVERYACSVCLSTIDARRPPLFGAAGRYPGGRA